MQANARVKQVELARNLDVAQSTVLERVRRLEEQGYIKGYKATIDPEKLNLSVQAFVSVTLKRHGVEIIRKFEDGIRAMSFVRTCYHLTGRFDYLLHVAVRDLEQLGVLVKTQIASLPGFGKSETFVIFSEIKADIGWPIDVTPFPKTKVRMKTGKLKNTKK
jgi:Lrp/AsnC family leucine-responsive transcriptional regulator